MGIFFRFLCSDSFFSYQLSLYLLLMQGRNVNTLQTRLYRIDDLFRGFFGYFFGTALFANIGLGYIVQHLGWNWNFIVLLGACALAFLFIAFTYKEEQYLVKNKN